MNRLACKWDMHFPPDAYIQLARKGRTGLITKCRYCGILIWNPEEAELFEKYNQGDEHVKENDQAKA